MFSEVGETFLVLEEDEDKVWDNQDLYFTWTFRGHGNMNAWSLGMRKWTRNDRPMTTSGTGWMQGSFLEWIMGSDLVSVRQCMQYGFVLGSWTTFAFFEEELYVFTWLMMLEVWPDNISTAFPEDRKGFQDWDVADWSDPCFMRA